MKLILFSFLFVLSSLSFSQASWTYSYTFKLQDSGGNEINADHINNGKVKIYLHHDGAHIRENGTFLSDKNEFHVSGHTIATNGRLIILLGKDTMDIELATHNIDLGTINIETGHFLLPYWASEKHYKCTNHQDDCKLKQNVKSFKKDKQPEYKKYDMFGLVNLKLSREKD